ncbi:PREDICTED: immunity-related GTPase family M protein isoform X2 [Chinchilla lanigera]|uniref:IRG-type G domain-containing protein n=1 Tax=Chinchilla lanigera TaxID=34839 RepID=A0A8C2VQ26_CHILA|nr:PREDICTED: immunity-related GTPase family M protein isoform X2 [Chinchilla lanigera]XP_005376107.1 PREDICTED: immunity-related GTPase family M protein isoform X2 [Chinchilla lanigera]XP_013363597.1 PREDICTED: immunity-related GTPase family M protein isoform X2 [Chinchilla lanigera]XP_013363598.1 PREDICTED: immunity-related GTPase family M protein isoform X2 [Chinchilla lanigera]
MRPVERNPRQRWEVAPLLPAMAEDHRTPLSASFTSVASYQRGYSVPPEVSRRLEKALREGKLLEVSSVARETVETVSRAQVSVAVTGDSGNGMSSFINALREIGHEETASAPTGVVRTTLTPARYTSPRFPDVSLWDLPGMGASGQSLDHYLGELQFGQYDLFLIIASEQFSAHHVRLAKAVQQCGKRFYVIWTKVDRDLSTTPLSKVLLLQTIQENILECLRKEGVRDPPIFLVSSLDPSLHDFPALRRKLKVDISSIRCCGPLKALSSICEEVINEKAASLKAKVSRRYLQDALGVGDAEDLEQCLRAYRLRFGVDDESLQQVAWSTGSVVSEYRTILPSRDWHGLRRADWKLRLSTCSVATALLCLLPWVPCCGRRMARWLVRVTHRRMLHLVAQDTKAILRKILDDSTCPA